MLLLLVTMLTCTQSICWSMPEHIAYNSSCLSFKFGLRWHLDYSRQNGKFSIHLEVPLVKAPDLIFACCLSHNYFIIICYSRTIKCALLRDYMVLRNTTGLQSKCHWWSILFWLGVWYQNYSKGAEQSIKPPRTEFTSKKHSRCNCLPVLADSSVDLNITSCRSSSSIYSINFVSFQLNQKNVYNMCLVYHGKSHEMNMVAKYIVLIILEFRYIR